MDPLTIIAVIGAVMKLASIAAQAGHDVAPFAKAIYDTFVNGKDVTQADLDALEKRVDDLSAELQLPLPPETAT